MAWEGIGPAWPGEALAGNAGFQLHASAFDANAVFNFVAALVLEVLRLLLDEALEIFQAWRTGFFARLGACLDHLPVEFFDFFFFARRIGYRQRESGSGRLGRSGPRSPARISCYCTRRRSHCGGLACILGSFSCALGFHSFRGSSEMALLCSAFLLNQFLAPHVLVFRVCL